jgi:hypothetical protein
VVRDARTLDHLRSLQLDQFAAGGYNAWRLVTLTFVLSIGLRLLALVKVFHLGNPGVSVLFGPSKLLELLAWQVVGHLRELRLVCLSHVAGI